jgi:hypothetical protein
VNKDIPAAKSGALQKGSKKEKFYFLGNDCKDSDQISVFTETIHPASTQTELRRSYRRGNNGHKHTMSIL